MIEFNCPHCSKPLRTADDKAGVTANCPGCNNLVTVPAASMTPAEESFPAPLFPPGRGNAATVTCPMCGAENPSQRDRCQMCGEAFRGIASGTHGGMGLPLEIGSTISVTWKLFQKNIGLCVLSSLIVNLLFLVLFGGVFVGFLVLTAATGVNLEGRNAAAGGGPDETAQMLFSIFFFGGIFASIVLMGLLYVYVTMGQLRLMLQLVRGEPAKISDMFKVGRFYGRALLATFLFMLMVTCGYLLLIIPGIVLSVMFSLYLLVLVDQDVPAVESLRRAYRLSQGNLLAMFGAWMIVALISTLGNMVCSLVSLFSLGYMMLMAAVMYETARGGEISRPL